MTTYITLKDFAKANGLTEKAAEAFWLYAEDAGNWSGNPWTEGNVGFGKGNGSRLAALTKRGLLNTQEDGDAVFIVFTREGVDLANAHGIAIGSWLGEKDGEIADVRIVADEAAKAAREAEAAPAAPAPAADADEKPAGEWTRKQCLQILADAGYEGPTSYLMPKLREITASVMA